MLWDEFNGRWAKVLKGVIHDIKHVAKSDNDGVYTTKYNTRGITGQTSAFNSTKKPKVLDEDNMNKEYCIKIQDYFDANKLMSSLFDKLEKEFEEELFEKNEDKFKIIITFDEEDLVLKIKLYQLKNGLILKFFKVSGNKEYFLKKFDEIYSFVEEIIKNLD